ncbi:MAG: glutaredoxin [Cytophagaceae bacterium]|nr:MAG: glutaredoxin [Cytophagaceae bacterium]
MKTLSQDHVLLIKKTCPYCMKVLMAAEELKIALQSRDVAQDAAAHALLLQRGGKQQVPCLLHGEQAMYESEAIITYLRAQA